MKKIALLLILPVLLVGLVVPAASAGEYALDRGMKSFMIPGWGQYENGDFQTRGGKIKVGIMAAIEVAAIITTAVVGSVVGAPQVWIGIGLFLGNHVCHSSSSDRSRELDHCQKRCAQRFLWPTHCMVLSCLYVATFHQTHAHRHHSICLRTYVKTDADDTPFPLFIA